ncbi:MAG: M4 family metallopeptidase [Chloroflexi bacterium]|nr:M4 family metallopeptidase [Chloroflexota bacterium]
MKGYKLVSLLVSVLLILSMSMAAMPASTASAGPAPTGQAQGSSGETLGYDPDTGHLIFIGAPQGSAIASAAGDLSALSAEQQADSFVNVYASAFGLSNPSQELDALSTSPTASGGNVTRYQQVYQGVPVFGGNLVVSTADEGGLVAMAGKFSTGLTLSVAPSVAADKASGIAQALVTKLYDLQPGQKTKAGTPALWVYDEQMFTDSIFGPQLVWNVEVTVSGAPIREVVLVNAQTGKVSQHYNEIDTSWALNGKPGTRKPSERLEALVGGTPVWSIYDAHNLWIPDSELPGIELVCDNTSLTCGTDAGALDARDYTLDTYDFYWNLLGRDSIDDAGMELISTIHYGDPFSAGPMYWFKNAYWNGDQMVYGDRVAVDDVVAHELTHGVTDYTSGLLYLYQPGAINESMSDVFGELIDLSNVDDYYVNDTTGRWLMGESIEGAAKSFRSMKNPPQFGDPDKMSSALYYKQAGDQGGVHTNSGVNNKAAYLMTDGGAFNGYTVTGIGINKVAALYYKVNNEYLFPGSDYLDLYYALNSACDAMVGGPEGMTSGNCDQVEKATKAVQMDVKPVAVNGPAVDACPTGTAESTSVFTEDFEAGTTEWVFTGTGTDIDFTTTWPFAVSTTASPSWNISEYPDSIGVGSVLWGGGPAELNDYLGEVYNSYYDWWFYDFAMEYAYEDATLASPLDLPAGKQIYLTFDHMYKFDSSGPTKNWDGGILEYSDNGGAGWKDAKPLFSAGTNYNGTVVNFGTDSAYQPLSAKQAFVANSLNGVLHMRYNLTSLAGQNDIKLRFRAGYDVSTDWGWFIDNVSVHTCIGTPTVPLLTAPAANALVTDLTPTLDWSDSTPLADLSYYIVEVSTTPDFGFADVYQTVSAPTSTLTVDALDELDPNTTYYWHVGAFNVEDNARGWSLTRSFRTGIEAPTLVAPLNLATLNTKRPTFEWDSVPNALTYTLEVSVANTFASKAVNATVPATVNPTMLYTHTADLLPNKLYYWRVRVATATGGRAPGFYSEVRQFTTANPPSMPTLVAPAANALLTDLTPLLDWSNSTLPLPAGSTTFANYNLQVDNNNDFSSPEVDEAVGTLLTDSSFTVPTDLAVNTTYYWRVNAENTGGQVSAWSLVRNFRTAIGAPTLVAPLDLATLNTKRPTFEWDSVSGALTYTLEVSVVNTFATKAINATVPATVNPTVLYTHTADLLPNKLYYWRVRVATATGGRTPGFYSDVREFTTTNPPSVPALVAPAANALLTDLTPLLDWSNSTLPLPAGSTTFANYNLQVAVDNSDFTLPVVDVPVGALLTDSSYTIPTDLDTYTTYYWSVNAENTDGQVSAWSLVRSFRTAIGAPTLVAPLDLAALNTKRPTFEWDFVPDALTYTLEVSVVDTFATKAINATVPATINPTVLYTHTADLLPNKTYFWRVRVATATGGRTPGFYSDVREFTTGNPPSTPALVAPAANALVTTLTPTLDWANSTLPLPTGSTTFANYNLQVDNNNDFSSPEVDEAVGALLTDSSYTLVTSLDPKTTYYWRVNAESNVGVSAWSLVRTFRTVLATPVLNEPALDSVTTTYRPIFDWDDVPGAVSYTIQVSKVSNFATTVVNVTVTGDSTWAPTTNLPKGPLFWRVKANSAAGGYGPSNWATSSFYVVALTP